MSLTIHTGIIINAFNFFRHFTGSVMILDDRSQETLI